MQEGGGIGLSQKKREQTVNYESLGRYVNRKVHLRPIGKRVGTA